MVSEGLYIKAAIYDILFYLIDEKRKYVTNFYSIFAAKAMFVHYLAQKYDLLYQLTYIIEYGNNTDSESWYNIEVAKVELYFEQFYEEMVKKIFFCFYLLESDFGELWECNTGRGA